MTLEEFKQSVDLSDPVCKIAEQAATINADDSGESFDDFAEALSLQTAAAQVLLAIDNFRDELEECGLEIS